MAVNYLIIPHSVRFVKRFFEIFSSFFLEAFHSLDRLPFSQQPNYYIILRLACQEVFSKFFKFFLEVLRFSQPSVAFCGDLIIISQMHRLVKGFSEIF